MEADALRRNQMDIQRELLRALAGKLAFAQVRVESNRADGTGRVGAEIAATGVADLRQLAPADTAGWKRVTRISHDGGATWEP